jgi:transposase
MELPKPSLFVGVDWATQSHEVCVLDPTGKTSKHRSFEHSGDGLADLIAWLDQLSGGCAVSVWVAIEMPHGAVVESLLDRGCQVFAINPKQLDRFRDRFSPAGAKDDRRDAHVLADSLRTDSQCFRHLHVQSPTTIQIREWTRLHDELVGQRSKCTNRVREQLRRYFPQYLDIAEEVSEGWFLELWNRIPTPECAAITPVRVVTGILKRHRIRRITSAEVLEILRRKPVTVAAGTVQAATAHLRVLIDQLQVLNRQLRESERSIDAFMEQLNTSSEDEAEDQEKSEQRDVEILLSLPGVGRIVAGTLLAEAAEALQQRAYHSLRALAGVAPITVSSGTRIRVVMRTACNPLLRNACYHWARSAMQVDLASKEIYTRARQRGCSHGRALRAVADRLLSIACAMLRDGTLYDPDYRVNAARANSK